MIPVQRPKPVLESAIASATNKEPANRIINQYRCYKTYYCENIPGSSLSPRYYLWHNIMGRSARPGQLQCDIRRNVIEKRLGSLRISWRHRLDAATALQTGASSIDMDPLENRYLLCGGFSGEMTIIDLEMGKVDSSGRIEHTVIPVNTLRPHNSSVTRCQWNPQDTNTFISSDVEGKIKLWDVNAKEIVEEYSFRRQIVDMHWCNADALNRRIAVAYLSSNIRIIDPRRARNLSENISWLRERVVAVRWSAEHGYILAACNNRGQIAIWDVRSPRRFLTTVQPPWPARVRSVRFSEDGLYLVAFSSCAAFTIYSAHTMKIINEVVFPSSYSDRFSAAVHFDICSDSGVLRACIPVGDKVLVLTLDKNYKDSFRILLIGHFDQVCASLFRQKCHQVITSGYDRMVRIWSPDMDEILPDGQLATISKQLQDKWDAEEAEHRLLYGDAE